MMNLLSSNTRKKCVKNLECHGCPQKELWRERLNNAKLTSTILRTLYIRMTSINLRKTLSITTNFSSSAFFLFVPLKGNVALTN